MRGWPLVRLVLAAVYVVVLAGVVAAHRTDAPLQALYADVEDGRVSRVHLEGGLGAGGSGYAEQTVTWRSGWRGWVAELVVEQPPGQPDLAGTSRQRTGDDVAAEVRRRDPGVEVVSTGYRSGFTRELYGSQLPLPLWVLSLLGLLTGLALLVSGPEPYRANRWAWFWLSYVPGGPLAFLALSGPTRGLRTPPSDEPRLTGGRGFLLSLLLGGLASAGVGLAAYGLWPPHPLP